MKEPKKIKLTDCPTSKDVKKIPLTSPLPLYDDYGYVTSLLNDKHDVDMTDDTFITKDLNNNKLDHENNSQNNS